MAEQKVIAVSPEIFDARLTETVDRARKIIDTRLSNAGADDHAETENLSEEISAFVEGNISYLIEAFTTTVDGTDANHVANTEKAQETAHESLDVLGLGAEEKAECLDCDE